MSTGLDGTPSAQTNALTVYRGELVAGGSFTTAGSIAASNIARWDGAAWHPLGGGTNGAVLALSSHVDSLFVGGAFTIAGEHVSGFDAHWACACPSDFDASGSLTINDIFDFLGAWFAGLPAGDFDGSSSLSVQDIFDFLAAWFAGC